MLNPLLVMRLLRSQLGMLVLSAVCLMIWPAQRAAAFDQLDLSLGSLSGPDWQAEQLRFTLDWGNPTTAYRLQIAQRSRLRGALSISSFSLMATTGSCRRTVMV
ncbi:MAG: hypothetical protein P8Z77_08415 [Candidatus Thiodiazotropha sp.]